MSSDITSSLTASLMEGLYLMLVGMSFVLAFLTIVVFSLGILARLAPEEPAPIKDPADKKKQNDQRLLAVISAAVHRYREDQNQK